MKSLILAIIVIVYVCAACKSGSPVFQTVSIEMDDLQFIQNIPGNGSFTLGEVAGRGYHTPIPLVYKRDTVFYVLNGLDTLRKSEVWGFALRCGVFLRKTDGGDGRFKDVESANWYDTKVFAEAMNFNGMRGRLPSWKLLKEHKQEDRDAINQTALILLHFGIDADRYQGWCWCREEYKGKNVDFAYEYSLNIMEYYADKYNTESFLYRIIVDYSK